MTVPLASLASQNRTPERLLLVAISGPDAAFGYTLLVLSRQGVGLSCGSPGPVCPPRVLPSPDQPAPLAGLPTTRPSVSGLRCDVIVPRHESPFPCRHCSDVTHRTLTALPGDRGGDSLIIAADKVPVVGSVSIWRLSSPRRPHPAPCSTQPAWESGTHSTVFL